MRLPLRQTNKKNGRVIECGTCGKPFYVSAGELRPRRTGTNAKGEPIFCGPRRYCGKKCQDSALKTNRPLNCATCGMLFYVSRSQQRLRNRQCCSKACAAKMTRTRAVERRESGVYTQHQLDRIARYSKEAKLWRKAVFERDDYTCQTCGKRGEYLEADHLLPWAYYPSFRFHLFNGRTLCRPCHDKTKMSAKAMKLIYGATSVETREALFRRYMEVNKRYFASRSMNYGSRSS